MTESRPKVDVQGFEHELDPAKFREQFTNGPFDAGMVEGIELKPFNAGTKRPDPRFGLAVDGKDTNRKRNAVNVHTVLTCLRAGLSIRDAAEEAGVGQRTWYRWLDVDPQLIELQKRAQELGSHALAQQCLDISDDVAEDKEAVMRAKLRVETRLNLIKAWNRAYYGEQVQVQTEHKFEFNVSRADTAIAPRPEDLVPDLNALEALDRDHPEHPDFDDPEAGAKARAPDGRNSHQSADVPCVDSEETG